MVEGDLSSVHLRPLDAIQDEFRDVQTQDGEKACHYVTNHQIAFDLALAETGRQADPRTIVSEMMQEMSKEASPEIDF